MVKKVLTVLKVDLKTAEDYKHWVDEVFEEHRIIEVFGITTDNERTMEATFESNFRNSCFSHLASKACKYTMDSSDSLKRIRKMF